MAAPLKYIKSQEVKDLELLCYEWRKARGINKPKRYYTDKTASGLEKCIINYTVIRGWQAEKIQSMGRQILNNGKPVFVRNNNTTGQADLSLIIKGRAVKVEVKCKWTGDNIQSEKQKEYQKQVEKVGGIYLIIREFSHFKHWLDKYLNIK